MSPELVCPQHGPYDASQGQCPYCQAQAGHGRPSAPPSLSEDDMDTDLGAAPNNYAFSLDDEAETDLGIGRRSGAKFLDDDEPTDLSHDRSIDRTELYEESTESGPLAILWVKDGRRRGHIYKVKDDTLVGREQGHITLPDDRKVSSLHARFRFEDDQFVLWDFGSRNGSFINGTRITSATPLAENDEIKFGETVFVFKVLP